MEWMRKGETNDLRTCLQQLLVSHQFSALSFRLHFPFALTPSVTAGEGRQLVPSLRSSSDHNVTVAVSVVLAHGR